MKNILIISLILFTFLISCTDDSPYINTPISELIVGKWYTEDKSCSYEFTYDGMMIQNDTIYGNYFIDDDSYSGEYFLEDGTSGEFLVDKDHCYTGKILINGLPNNTNFQYLYK